MLKLRYNRLSSGREIWIRVVVFLGGGGGGGYPRPVLLSYMNYEIYIISIMAITRSKARAKERLA